MALGKLFYIGYNSQAKYKALADCSPVDVQEYISAGIAQKAWKVGDSTGNVMSSNSGHHATILAFNHNKDLETEGKNSVHFCMPYAFDGFSVYGSANSTDLRYVHCRQNTSNNYSLSKAQGNVGVNAGGWADSQIRKKLIANDGIGISEDWFDVMYPCTKYTDNHGCGKDTSSFVTATSDKIFLPSEFEAFGYKIYANSAEQNYQKHYDYWETVDNRKLKRMWTSTAAIWWLRSPHSKNSTQFCTVNESGFGRSENSNYSYGIVPCFVIAA